MAFIYVSTDSYEAQRIIDPFDINNNNFNNYKFHEMDMSTGDNLSKRIGFNPMCSIRLDEDTPFEALDEIAMKLLEKGLFVTVDTKKKLQNYVPSDISVRDMLIKFSLIKQREYSYQHIEPGYCLMVYSNDPCQIKEI